MPKPILARVVDTSLKVHLGQRTRFRNRGNHFLRQPYRVIVGKLVAETALSSMEEILAIKERVHPCSGWLGRDT